MNKRHYEHTLPNIRGSLSNTYLTNRTAAPKGRYFTITIHIYIVINVTLLTEQINISTKVRNHQRIAR